MDRAPFESTNEVEQADLVDEFYIPLVRALGNLVILFAQAEADLIDLLAELNGGNERAAYDVLKSPTAKEEIITLLEASGIQGFDLRELIAGINTYWSDKERRNRYMHDEWYVGSLSAGGAVPATRGLPRRKGSDVVWDEPTSIEVWGLARKFLDYKSLFSHGAYELRRSRRVPSDGCDEI